MVRAIIQTERLVLRPWELDDLTDILSYAQDDEWSRYLPTPRPYTREDAKAFLASQILLERDKHSSWAIEHEAHCIGGINVRFIGDHRIAELGYSVARRAWRRGLATEAARAVVAAAFDGYPSLLRIRAMADARNGASIRVLEKVGMMREGVLRSNRFTRDEPVDEVWFGILRAEWRRQSG